MSASHVRIARCALARCALARCALARCALALCALVPCATGQDPDPPGDPAGRLVQALADLGDRQRLGRAIAELDRLTPALDVATVRRLRSEPGPLLAGIARGREQIPHGSPSYRAWFEHRVASTLVDLGLHVPALQALRSYLSEPTEPPENAGLRRYLALGLCLQAELEHDLGEGESAAATAVRAERFAEGKDSIDVLADAVGIHGRVLAHLGVLKAAHALLERQEVLASRDLERQRSSLEEQGQGGRPNLESFQKSCQYRGEFYLTQNRPERALRVVDEYDAMPDAIPAPELDVVRGIAQFQLGQRDPAFDPEATATLTRCLTAGSLPHAYRMRSRIGLARLALRRGDLVAARQQLELLRELGASGHDADSTGQQQAEIESVASRLLRAEHAAEPVPDARLRAQLARHRRAYELLLESWSRAPLRRGGVGFLTYAPRRATVVELIELTRVLEGDERAAEIAADDLLAAQARTTTARELGVAAVTADELRRVYLRERQGVLVLLPSPHRTLLLAIDAAGARLFDLPSSLRFEELVSALRRELGRGPADVPRSERADHGRRLDALAVELAGDLLPGRARRAMRAWDTVTIADFGFLGGLPWECLALEPGRLLGEQVGVNTLSSIPVGIHMIRSRYRPVDRRDASLHLFATLGGAPALIGARTETPRRIFSEADAAALLAPYRRQRLLRGPDVTVAALSDWCFDATVTHILAHGAEDRSVERSAGLALFPSAGDTGFLGCDRVDALRVSGLVVLSACGSGRSRRRVGDDAERTSLGGAFLRAGAHTVIQSAADLTLKTHLRITASLHRHLMAGRSPAQALRDARREGRAAGLFERFGHAQIQVFGLGHLPVVE